MTPGLAGLELGGPLAAWEALGFAIQSGRAAAGPIDLRFDPSAPPGLGALALHGVEAGTDLDGIACTAPGAPPPPSSHPNGVQGVDHVVITTPGLERTLGRLGEVGLEVRRTREAGGGLRQAFLVAGQAVLEVVGDVPEAPAARLWGVTFVVPDVDALAERFPQAVGTPRDAVQPGRRIVTAREKALGVAFMTPR